ncbi:MAG: hypothetical protein ACYC2K_15790 [Gemmatimonadales bacterium]
MSGWPQRRIAGLDRVNALKGRSLRRVLLIWCTRKIGVDGPDRGDVKIHAPAPFAPEFGVSSRLGSG